MTPRLVRLVRLWYAACWNRTATMRHVGGAVVTLGPRRGRQALYLASGPHASGRHAPGRHAPVPPALAAAALAAVLAGCAPFGAQPGSRQPGGEPLRARAAEPAPLVAVPSIVGDPESGRRLFAATGCAGCHTIAGGPGASGASGVAGPNLTNVVLRPTLAGSAIPMTPETMTRWLIDPSALKPGTTMPSVGLTPEEAQDLTAFLYSQPRSAPSGAPR